MEVAAMSHREFKELVEGWLENSQNPATRMEVELNSAREQIKQLEHKINEDKKISDLKDQED